MTTPIYLVELILMSVAWWGIMLAPLALAMPQAIPMERMVRVMTMWAAWWGVRMVAILSPAMPQAIPMEVMVVVMMRWVAWWGISTMAALSPAMPQAIPVGVKGGTNSVGGLVGKEEQNSRIISSYATGNPSGGANTDRVGGLVGSQSGSITSSYATGDPTGGASGGDRVGGLVGYQRNGRIISSYATGNPNGGAGNFDDVGGLVGRQFGGHTTSSYATGNANGGSGTDYIGGLLGYRSSGNIIFSYGFGTHENGSINSHGTPPSGVISASGLTQENSGNSDTNRWSNDAWDFWGHFPSTSFSNMWITTEITTVMTLPQMLTYAPQRQPFCHLLTSPVAQHSCRSRIGNQSSAN